MTVKGGKYLKFGSESGPRTTFRPILLLLLLQLMPYSCCSRPTPQILCGCYVVMQTIQKVHLYFLEVVSEK